MIQKALFQRMGTKICLAGLLALTSPCLSASAAARPGPLPLDSLLQAPVRHDPFHPVIGQFNPNLALFVNGNAGDMSRIRYESMLANSIDGLTGGSAIGHPDTLYGRKVTFRNDIIAYMYAMALGYSKYYFYNPNRLELDVPEPSNYMSFVTGQAAVEWVKLHGLCYELVVPPALNDSTFGLVKQDLDRLLGALFDIHGDLEKRYLPCLVLMRDSTSAPVPDSPGGTPEHIMGRFVFKLHNDKFAFLPYFCSMLSMQHSPIPILDESGYGSHRVDMELHCDMSQPESINQALKPYGFQFVKAKRWIDMVVLRRPDGDPNIHVPASSYFKP